MFIEVKFIYSLGMRGKFFITLIAVGSLLSCVNNKTSAVVISDNSDECKLAVDTSTLEGAYLFLNRTKCNFGTISRRDVPLISIGFNVTNWGKSPLLIMKGDVFCGCMSVDFPKTPIMPNEKSIITVNVDTREQLGVFDKEIFIKSNAYNDVELICISGNINN